jgi:flagellar biosynthesis/type III secretory pathway protein FliH
LLEVNSFMNSDDKDFNEIGLFLYRRNNGKNGLSKDETETLIKAVHRIQTRIEHEIVEELEKAHEKGYSEGFDDGQRNCNCDTY